MLRREGKRQEENMNEQEVQSLWLIYGIRLAEGSVWMLDAGGEDRCAQMPISAHIAIQVDKGSLSDARFHCSP